MSQEIRVLVADDHALFARCFAEWLSRAPDIHLVGVVDNGDDVVRCAAQDKPNVVLLDIDMPGLSCFEAARLVSGHCPDCALVFVSAHTHDHYIEQALKVGTRRAQ